MSIPSAQAREARRLLGWTLSTVGGKSDLSASTISFFENGKRRPSALSVSKIRKVFEASSVEFTNGGEPGVRMRNDLIKLQFRNAQLRGKITTALKRADDALQHADDERAKLLVRVSEDSVETLADVFENLRGRALALVKAGVAKRGDFPEIG